MKRTILCLLVLMLCMAFSVSAYGQLLVDDADLLTSWEKATLEEKLKEVSDKLDMDVVLLTVDSLDGSSAQFYAEDYYDSNGYADEGVLLLVSIEEREYWVAPAAGTDVDVARLEDAFLSDLRDGDYLEAFLAFADNVDAAVSPSGENLPVVVILICLVIGAVIAFIATGVMKSQLRSVRSQNTANSYVLDHSFHLAHSRDIFLYRNVTRTPKPQNNGSSGGKRGGGGGRF